MAHSLLKSLFLYFTFAVSVAVLAAPAHQDQITKIRARGITRREDQPLSRSRATAPVANSGSRRSRGESNGVRKRVTNAMRFAQGLPPLPPSKLYKGSRAGSAHQARSSPVPVYVPSIVIFGPDGPGHNDPLGYLSRDLNIDWSAYYLTPECTSVNAQLFSGALTSAFLPSEYSNIGFAVEPGFGTTFGSGSSNWAWMAGTATTTNGSPPFSSTEQTRYPGVEMYIESSVWSLGENNELIVTWINPNGDAVPMQIGWAPASFFENSIIISADLSAFDPDLLNGDEIKPIRLYINGRGCQH